MHLPTLSPSPHERAEVFVREAREERRQWLRAILGSSYSMSMSRRSWCAQCATCRRTTLEQRRMSIHTRAAALALTAAAIIAAGAVAAQEYPSRPIRIVLP